MRQEGLVLTHPVCHPGLVSRAHLGLGVAASPSQRGRRTNGTQQAPSKLKEKSSGYATLRHAAPRSSLVAETRSEHSHQRRRCRRGRNRYR